MRNAGLDEAQAGIRIAGRNINNLRYTDDTTLMAESEEELMKVTADLLKETLQVRREWQDILKVMKEKNLQPRLLYLARSHSNMKEKSKALQISKS